MRRSVVWVLGCSIGLGCAGRGASGSSESPGATASPTATAPPSQHEQTSPITPSARRIYLLGEERYAEARYPEAVALWGHAMLQLPEGASADTVRHKLLTRMGHGLLMAYSSSDDPAYLRDAKQMCELYLVEHEARLGQTEQAKAERGEVYELLYEIESRLDLEGDDELDAEDTPTQVTMEEVVGGITGAEGMPAQVATAGIVGGVTKTGAPPSPQPEPTTAETEPLTEPETEPTESDDEALDATEAESPDDGELHRFIRVRRVEWARLDDPRVIAFFRDPRDEGPSLLDSGLDPLHGPRVLVRAGGLPRSLATDPDATSRREARRVGLAVLEAARPELRRCYEVAMSRDPIMATRVEVELTVEADGRVARPHLVGGSLVDAEGDACLAQVLRSTVLPEPDLSGSMALALPLQFFHQDATLTKELFLPTRLPRRAYTGTAGADPMPAIDANRFSQGARGL